jgi:hypothetical protein
MVAMTAQQREQAAVLAADRVQVPPTGQEVVVDDADDMDYRRVALRQLGQIITNL